MRPILPTLFSVALMGLAPAIAQTPAAQAETNVGAERPAARDPAAAAADAQVDLAAPAAKPATAASPVTLRPDDIARLERLDASFGNAMRQALAGGAREDVMRLTAGLAGQPLTAEQAAGRLAGDWSCQMIKLGDTTALTVYQPFQCAAGTDGIFEKLTGSQRTKGSIFIHDGQLIYAGTGFIADDTPPPYEDLPAEVNPQATPQRMPEVGLVEMTGPDRGYILFPDPYLESQMNVMLLTRQ